MTDSANEPIRVVSICGSLRESSFTRQALAVALRGAAEVGAETQMIDLRMYELPFCVGKGVPYPADVARLRADVRAAQSIILGTPEYHGSFSGVLKNALDLMGFDEFGSKIVGLVGVAGGEMGALNALNGLRLIGRSLHAWVVPHQVSIAQVWKRFDGNGRLTDERLEERLKKVGQEVTRFAHLLTSKSAQEFLQQWEQALPNPGGK